MSRVRSPFPHQPKRRVQCSRQRIHHQTAQNQVCGGEGRSGSGALKETPTDVARISHQCQGTAKLHKSNRVLSSEARSGYGGHPIRGRNGGRRSEPKCSPKCAQTKSRRRIRRIPSVMKHEMTQGHQLLARMRSEAGTHMGCDAVVKIKNALFVELCHSSGRSEHFGERSTVEYSLQKRNSGRKCVDEHETSSCIGGFCPGVSGADSPG